MRQEVVARQLDRELPPAPVRIIDLGCGQGTQALRLARRGYEVTGVDASPGLLARFERDLAAEPAVVRGRVRVEHGLIEDYAERGRVSPLPVVLCHGVLMYSADPDPVLSVIARMTAPGGLVSLLVRNGDALAVRPGLLGDWAACAEAFDSDRYPNRLGVTARADRLADLSGRLAGHGLQVTAWYGVRVFTDADPDDAEPPPACRPCWTVRSGPDAPTPTGRWRRCCTCSPGALAREPSSSAGRSPGSRGCRTGRGRPCSGRGR